MSLLQVALNILNAAGAVINPATAEGQQRHETHAAAHPVVSVPTTAATIATLLGGAVPSWATSCRLYVGSAGRIAYSCDGTDPAFSSGDATHGAPLAKNTGGHLIPGAASLAALRLVAETATTKVTIEFLG